MHTDRVFHIHCRLFHFKFDTSGSGTNPVGTGTNPVGTTSARSVNLQPTGFSCFPTGLPSAPHLTVRKLIPASRPVSSTYAVHQFHTRPGFSIDRPVLISRHCHSCLQLFLRPNTFALLASPTASMHWSHFANGGISGTGSFSYPHMHTLFTRSGTANSIFPTPTGFFYTPTGCQ